MVTQLKSRFSLHLNVFFSQIIHFTLTKIFSGEFYFIFLKAEKIEQIFCKLKIANKLKPNIILKKIF